MQTRLQFRAPNCRGMQIKMRVGSIYL